MSKMHVVVGAWSVQGRSQMKDGVSLSTVGSGGVLRLQAAMKVCLSLAAASIG